MQSIYLLRPPYSISFSNNLEEFNHKILGKANCGARGYPTDIAYQIVVSPVILRLPTESSINQNYWCVKLIDCKCLGTGKRDGSCNVCKDWIANNTCPKLEPASVAAQWCSLLMGQQTNKKSSRQMMKRIRSEYETVDRSRINVELE